MFKFYVIWKNLNTFIYLVRIRYYCYFGRLKKIRSILIIEKILMEKNNSTVTEILIFFIIFDSIIIIFVYSTRNDLTFNSVTVASRCDTIVVASSKLSNGTCSLFKHLNSLKLFFQRIIRISSI